MLRLLLVGTVSWVVLFWTFTCGCNQMVARAGVLEIGHLRLLLYSCV